MTAARPPGLPAPRVRGHYAIALVCLGNICRSPIAEVVLSHAVAEAGLSGRVRVGSGGTGGWHVGEPMDARAAGVLRAAGLDPDAHRARQWSPAWSDEHDLVLAMDHQNLADLLDAGADPARLRLFGDHDPVTPRAEVPDPYYGGPDGFEEVLAMVERTAGALVADLPAVLEADEHDGGAP